MRVKSLLNFTPNIKDLNLIRSRCSDFLNESDGFPLVKSLPQKYTDLYKVKVRKRKANNKFTQTFNYAFEQHHYDLRQRAIFTHGTNSFVPENDPLKETFYIFPINGFKFMYSKEVEQSDADYKQVFESIFEQFGGEKANEMLSDLLRFTYASTQLSEGIKCGSEIIVYDIPYYYALRKAVYPNYNQLLTYITNSH